MVAEGARLMWSEYDDALRDLTDTINGRAPAYADREQYERDFHEPEPAYRWSDEQGNEYELHDDGRGPELADRDQEAADNHRSDGGYEQTIEEAGAVLEEISAQWHELSADDRAMAIEVANELRAMQQEQAAVEQGMQMLGHITDELHSRGYDVDEFVQLLGETGDLEHAMDAIEAIGPIPRTTDDALDQVLRYGRENREADQR
jgi:hypothetical protein